MWEYWHGVREEANWLVLIQGVLKLFRLPYSCPFQGKFTKKVFYHFLSIFISEVFCQHVLYMYKFIRWVVVIQCRCYKPLSIHNALDCSFMIRRLFSCYAAAWTRPSVGKGDTYHVQIYQGVLICIYVIPSCWNFIILNVFIKAKLNQQIHTIVKL